jgi:hypothetical protein
MGLTLLAVLVTALLLPGIVAAKAFYQAAQTREVEPAVPPLTSVDGIAQVGLFSVAVHATYVVMLMIARGRSWPEWMADIPTANPYVAMLSPPANLETIYALIAGLLLLCMLALVLGAGAGRLMMWRGEAAIFYGPMAEVLAKTGSGKDFIIAYVLTTIEQEGALIGYQGTVVSLLRDADRFPAKVVLKDASVFRLVMAEGRPLRREAGETIDWIALAADQWRNIAFKVFKVDNEEGNMGDGEAIDTGQAG